MSKPDKKAANQKPGKIVLLPVEQIEPSPFQARTAFDETEIAALAVSILQNVSFFRGFPLNRLKERCLLYDISWSEPEKMYIH